MTPRQHPLAAPALLLAGRGHHTSGPRNGVEAMRLAIRLGATGICSAAWLSASGDVVLHPRPTVGSLRRRRIADLDGTELPADLATQWAFYDALGPDTPLLVTSDDPPTRIAALETALAAGAEAALYLAAGDWRGLAELRTERPSSAARFVHLTSPGASGTSAEQHAAALRHAGIAGTAMPHQHWTGGAVALSHRFGRLCVGLGADHARIVERLLHIGVDVVAGDHADRLHDAVTSPAGFE